jgi:uncharacterized integral membrane protein
VKLSMVVLVALLGLVALFTVQNPEVVTVRFLSFTGNTLLLVVIVGSFGAGVLGAGLAALPGFFRRRSEAASAKRRTRELEAEVEGLKAEIDLLKKKPEPSKAGGAV